MRAMLDWTEERSRRRCELVLSEVFGELTEEEAKELKELQTNMRTYRESIAPLPALSKVIHFDEID